MASQKTALIKKIFEARFDPATGTLSKDVVTLKEVSEAIAGDPKLEGLNAANFMKDIVRSPNRNNLFPPTVAEAGWTARQEPGGGRCFRFVPLPPGQKTAFPTIEPDPALVADPHPVQSLSLPPASRKFGQPRETWLTHVVTNLGIVHTHFALHSPLDLVGVELLQSNVKLGRAEVDAIYLGSLEGGEHVLVSCEMKGPREVLDEDQIKRGADRVEETSDGLPVVPMGVKALGGGLVWIVEFAPEKRPLEKVREGVYRPAPAVPGI